MRQLDLSTESAVSSASRARQLARIVVAYWPETVRSCDRMIELSLATHMKRSRSSISASLVSG